MMVRVATENQRDMKTHIVTMFKSQILTVVPNAEQMMEKVKVIYGRDNKIIFYLKPTS